MKLYLSLLAVNFCLIGFVYSSNYHTIFNLLLTIFKYLLINVFGLVIKYKLVIFKHFLIIPYFVSNLSLFIV